MSLNGSKWEIWLKSDCAFSEPGNYFVLWLLGLLLRLKWSGDKFVLLWLVKLLLRFLSQPKEYIVLVWLVIMSLFIYYRSFITFPPCIKKNPKVHYAFENLWLSNKRKGIHACVYILWFNLIRIVLYFVIVFVHYK